MPCLRSWCKLMFAPYLNKSRVNPAIIIRWPRITTSPPANAREEPTYTHEQLTNMYEEPKLSADPTYRCHPQRTPWCSQTLQLLWNILNTYIIWFSLWRKANARNVTLYYPCWQYTNILSVLAVHQHFYISICISTYITTISSIPLRRKYLYLSCLYLYLSYLYLYLSISLRTYLYITISSST